MLPTQRLVEVRVHDIRLAARIGAHPHELARRQHLRVSVALALATVPNDLLDHTIDYTLIVHRAERLAEGHIALIETFAWRLAQRCLELPNAESVEVVVEKRGALPNGTASARVLLNQHPSRLLGQTPLGDLS